MLISAFEGEAFADFLRDWTKYTKPGARARGEGEQLGEEDDVRVCDELDLALDQPKRTRRARRRS